MKRPDWFVPGMVVAVALAWLVPEPGARGGVLHPEILTKLGVSLVFFLHGLLLSFRALAAGTLRWKLHLLAQGTTFGLFPLVGILALALIGPGAGPELRIGLFFLCALPSTVSSSVTFTSLAGGNIAAAVFNATLSNLLGVVLTPLWLAAVLGATGQVPPLGPVVLNLCLWFVLPLLLGQLLRPLAAEVVDRRRRAIEALDKLVILMLVYTSFCDSMLGGVWQSGARALLGSGLAAVLLLGSMLSVNWKLGGWLGLSRDERIAALFCGSKKTLAAGVPMARLIFGPQQHLALILLPLLIYHPLQLLVGGWLSARFARGENVS